MVLLVAGLVAGGVFALWRLRHRPRVDPADEARADAAIARVVAGRHGVALAPRAAIEKARTEDQKGLSVLAVQDLAGALGSDADNADLRLSLAMIAFRHAMPTLLSSDEAHALVRVTVARDPKGALVPAAIAWMALADNNPPAAMDMLRSDNGTVDGNWAKMRALQAMQQDPSAPAEALLQAEPGFGEACGVVGREAFGQGELASARRLLQGCVDSGVKDPVVERVLGDVADALGEFVVARDAYLAAGTDLHAAAIITQEGIPDPGGVVDRALGPNVPPAGLHMAWIGLLRGDLAMAKRGVERIQSTSAAGPEFSMARAAVALAEGKAVDAQKDVAGLTSAAASTLFARGRAAAGDVKGAKDAFSDALSKEPWNLAIHRERLALLAARAPADVPDALATLIALDPVTEELARPYREREAPWPVLAPSPWPVGLPAPSGALLGLVVEPKAADTAALEGLKLAPSEQGFLDLRLAWMVLQAGHASDARALAEKAVALLPDAPIALVVEAEAARVAADPSGAQSLLDEAEGHLHPPGEESAGPAAPLTGTAGDEPPPPPSDTPPPAGSAAFAWVKARLLMDKGDRKGAAELLRSAARAEPELRGLWIALYQVESAAAVAPASPAR